MPPSSTTTPSVERMKLILARRAELLRIESAIHHAADRIAAIYCRSAER